MTNDYSLKYQKASRSKKDRLERLYLLDQLRFLIKYDYELYTKSALFVQQSADLYRFLKECGCEDLERFFGLQDYNYKADYAYSERRRELFTVLRIRQRYSLTDFRYHLISVVKSNNIRHSWVIRNSPNIDTLPGDKINVSSTNLE